MERSERVRERARESESERETGIGLTLSSCHRSQGGVGGVVFWANAAFKRKEEGE